MLVIVKWFLWHIGTHRVISKRLSLSHLSVCLSLSLSLPPSFLVILCWAKLPELTGKQVLHTLPFSGSLRPTHSWDLGKKSRASVSAEQPVKKALSSQTHPIVSHMPLPPPPSHKSVSLGSAEVFFFPYLQSADNFPPPRISVLGGKESISSVFLKASLSSECGWKMPG